MPSRVPAISARIQRARKTRGLTQEVLAERVHVTRGAIGHWEQGVTLPSTAHLSTLAKVLGVPMEWLVKGGAVSLVITLVAFIAKWGLRFRLVGVTSFTFVLAISCWAFGLSYTPTVRIEGALRAPVVFDNGDDLIVAQASADFPREAIEPTLQQLAQNVRPGGRGSAEVTVRLRQLQPAGDGASKPVVLGETTRSFSAG